jgi:hypothetical protein
MERTPIPPRADLDGLRRMIEQRRAAGYSTTQVDNNTLESLLTESALFRNHFDSLSRRRKDAARARKQMPPKITPANADQYDDPR